MIFAQPFFITPHAVLRFQERVADIPAKQVIRLVQSALQDNRQVVGVQIFNHERRPVFRAKYSTVEYLIPVAPQSGKNRWPSVPTILLPGMQTWIISERSGWVWNS